MSGCSSLSLFSAEVKYIQTISKLVVYTYRNQICKYVGAFRVT